MHDEIGDEWLRLITAAQQGAATALGDLFERARPILLTIANREIGPQWAGKLSASDIVQDTMAAACTGFPSFAGESQAALLAWLRQILLHRMANVHRHYDTSKRKMGREEPLPLGGVVAQQPSPSSEVRGQEDRSRLEEAIDRLPELSRQAILLRHRENLSFSQIGQILDRSEGAAQKIWARAVQELQKELGSHEPE